MKVTKEQASSVSRMIDKSIYEETVKNYGEREPTWEEYKEADKAFRVRTNKSVASQAIHYVGSYHFIIIFGLIMPNLGFLLVPTVFVSWLIWGFSGWWLVASLPGAWYCLDVAKWLHRWNKICSLRM